MAFAAAMNGLGFVGCGDGRGSLFSPREIGDAGDGGAEGDASAGETNQTGGSRSRGGGPSTGGQSTGRGGSNAGRGGAEALGGSGPAGGGADGGADTGGGGEGGSGSDPLICPRFGRYEAGKKAFDIGAAFENATFVDCRLSWVVSLYLEPNLERELFWTKLNEMTLKLWGCVDGAPAFSLIYKPVSLSRAEARALVDAYLVASKNVAELSPSELRFVERELLQLAEPLVDDSLDDFSRSTCPDGGTGGSGTGGTGTGGSDGGEGGAGGPSDGGAHASFG
jgi:hypothetical protein